MLSVGLGLVGSITGTVAWYQYSTRVQAALLGTSVAGNNVNMEVKINSSLWKANYLTGDLASAVDNKTSLAPVTTGALEKDAALPTITENPGTEQEVTKTALRKGPVYQSFATNEWKVAKAGEDFVQFNLSVRVKNVDGNSGNATTYADKDVYLSKIEINDVTAGLDLANAVRIHIAAGPAATRVNALIAKTATSTNVSGLLDLNGDAINDTDKVFEWNTATTTYYGDYQMVDDDNDASTPDVLQSGVQESYAINEIAINPDTATDQQLADLSLGKTGTTADGLSMTVTIWLEGWQALAANDNSAIWDSSTYINKNLQIGMQFAVKA